MIFLAIRQIKGFLRYLKDKWINSGIFKARYRQKFEAQLIDGLTLLDNSLSSGLTLLQSLQGLIKNMSGPISSEFTFVIKEHQMGVSIEDALQNLGNRLNSEELDLVIRAMLISRESGANLSEIFSEIVATLRERKRIAERISTLTAQGRLQAIIVGSLPLILILVIYFIDADFILPLFRHPLGWLMLIVAILLEILGIVFIRKIVRIEV